MNSRSKRGLLVGGLFLVLTLALTYPQVLRLGDSVRDPGDPLLNTWILSWDADHIARLDLARFFDANIFYPQPKTLAYSEFLLPQALLALPIKLVSGNPVLAYNVVLLLAFLTTGLGMYVLARHLTGNTLAAVAAGVIYAFSPFMFSHLYHLQILTAGGIPLAFLFLHKFFEKGRFKDLLLFGLFFVVQALANGYYALYLGVFAGTFLAVFAVVTGMYRQPGFWLRLTACGALIALCLAPFFYQYYTLQKEMGFSRDISGSARLTSYLATPRTNVLYGRITARVARRERELFPGLTALLLGCAGAVLSLRFKRRRDPPSEAPGRRRAGRVGKALLWAVTIATLAYAGLFIVLLARSGIDIRLGPLGSFHAHSLAKTGVALLILLAAGVVIRWTTGARLLAFSPDWSSPWIYAAILILAFAFSFGASGPYRILYDLVPGFRGLRAVVRIHVFFMFGLAVLAAYGLAALSRRLAGRKRALAALVVLPCLIAAEYLSVPVPLVRVPVKAAIPPVYRWLAAEPGRPAVVEFPMPLPREGSLQIECPRVYFSAYHWKNLVNGFSGFFPPLYLELQRRYWTQPVQSVVRDLRSIGTRLIIVHSDELRNAKLHPVLDRLRDLPGEVREVRRFGPDFVFEILPGPRPSLLLASDPCLAPLDSRLFSARANRRPDLVRLAFDGRLDTRWDTDAVQSKGQWFELDLGRKAEVRGLTLRLGASPADYPRGLRVEISTDLQRWEKVYENDAVNVPLLSLLKPGQAFVEVPFGPVEARAIRLVQTGRDKEFFWSIHEIEVWAPK
jgi:hypothetical protein